MGSWNVAISGKVRALGSARFDLKLSPRQFPGGSQLPRGVGTGPRSGKQCGGVRVVLEMIRGIISGPNRRSREVQTGGALRWCPQRWKVTVAGVRLGRQARA